ncbi:hypothetical protein KDK_55460 [Dictyobacter kobayashii]|uniref:Uncharacterized protein n=2 Tax=Dictyobacter kobayashii TaxID=2014872 RepID=A0A402ARL2_9CHLR|nr:hypothetical protein KDK_55460 [Dictyobacter kobayashii]
MNGSGNHRDKTATERYNALRQKGAVTDDERLLSRPTQPLVSPNQPVPNERIREEEHAFERALNFDYTMTDPWRVFRIMSEFVNGFDVLAHIPPQSPFLVLPARSRMIRAMQRLPRPRACWPRLVLA